MIKKQSVMYQNEPLPENQHIFHPYKSKVIC